MKELIITTLLILITFCCEGQQLSKEQAIAIDKLCSVTFNEGNFPGMAVTVAIRDSIIWAKGYGYADVERRKEIDPKASIFRIGSVSKTVTSSGLAQLVEQGKVNLD